jgi:hypothetical protein
MKKLYMVNISVDKDILVAAESETKAIFDTKKEHAQTVMHDLHPSDMFVTAHEIKNKKDLRGELDSLPYTDYDDDDGKTVGEIWKEMEKYRKEQAHKEWLEKYHMTFDFYKEAQNG